jgi:hypothetical protein
MTKIAGLEFECEDPHHYRRGNVRVHWSEYGNCWLARAPGCSARGDDAGAAVKRLRKYVTEARAELKG